jgi:uncharacterized repeat protein (TIGR01451 family)
LVTLTGPYCGDGIKQSNEQCDDHNNLNGDGCSSTCTIEESKECILQLSKSTDKSNVKPGDIVTFTLRYKNVGNGDCTGGGVKIQEVLNSNLKYMGSYTKTLTGDSDGQSLSFGWQTTPGYVESTNTLTWNAHVVSPGEEGIIKFSVKVLEPAQCGDFTISNYFKIWSNEKGWQNSNTIKLYVDDDCYSPVCGNNFLDTGEQCDKGTLNGQVCNPLYGGSCTYCSNTCNWVTLTGPYCGDGTCSNGENCSTCPGDCGACADNIKPVVNITYPLAKEYCPHRISMTFYVYDDNLHSCTYTLNGASPVNVPSLVNGFNTITGITSVVGSNTWSVTCRDVSGNTALDSVIFTVTCLPTCGDGVCNGYETCSSCPGDCGVCPKDNCTICKDSKPLDDSGYDYYYLYQMNNKPTVISGEVTSDDLDLELDKTDSYSLKSKLPFIIIIFIIGVLTLLILIFIIRLSRR